MAWYDFFSNFYDSSLEALYRDARVSARDALDLAAGHRLLDAPTGTGQSVPLLANAVGPDGLVVGLDKSRGMLRRARERVARESLTNVRLEEADLFTLDSATLGGPFDRLHVFLGLSTLDKADEAFERLWAALVPGGRCAIVDVYAERLSFQGRMVNLIARADIRRRSWEPLEKRATGFSRVELPSKKPVGGTLFLAVGDKPR
ncbi:MAG TPA: class I SAM-dependent methyltransferase [Myxococcota bacterium]|nr:class I SAM-dependent methyltransferase [Myxococcota bacterium]